MIKRLLVLFLIVFLFMPIEAFANAAEPPNIIIILEDVPEGEKVEILLEEPIERIETKRDVKQIYFAVYYDYQTFYEAQTITFKGTTKSFDIQVPAHAFDYNKIYTLNYDTLTLTEGKSVLRSIKLIGLRLSLTLLLEGLVFYAFKFREKRTWLAFAAVNLLTQGYVNYILQGESPITPASYVFLSLILLEIPIFIIEGITLPAFIKEKRKLITFSCVILANLLSFILGGWMITHLLV